MAKTPKKREPLSAPSTPELPPPAAQDEPGPDEIIIEGVGPILDELRLTARPGRITILEGKNADGKTTALEAVAALGDKDVKLPKADRATGGRVAGFGVQINIAANGTNRRSGELICESINSKVDLGKIIDPRIEDLVAADAVRTKEIVGLFGIMLGPQHVQKLLGAAGPALWKKHCEQVDENLPAVDFLGKVKRALEAGARDYERDAQTLAGEVKGIEASLTRIPESPISLEEAQRQHSEATQAHVRAKTLAEQAEEQMRKRDEARQTNATAPAVVTVADAETDVAAKAEILQAETAARDELKRLLDAAESRVTVAIGNHNAALTALEQARGYAAKQAETTALFEASTIIPPSPQELSLLATNEEDAASRVATAISAQGRAPILKQRDAKATLAKEAADRGKLLRDACERLPSLLVESIKSIVPGLKVDRNMRLVLEATKRGDTFVAELSHGERAAFAMRLVAAAVASSDTPDEKPLVSLSQDAFEAMDGDARDELQANVEHFQIRLLTAQAQRESGHKPGIVVKEYGNDSTATESGATTRPG